MEKLEAEIKNKKIKSKGIVKKIHSLFDKEKKSIVIVQDGLIKYANPRAIKLVGYAPEELIGTKLYQKRLAGEDIPNIYETIIYHKDGSTIPIEVRASAINYHGRQADFVFIKKVVKKKKG